LTETAAVDGTVVDDNLPIPYSLVLNWTRQSGPGSVTFDKPHDADAVASFTATGDYFLKLCANDGGGPDICDTMKVTVSAPPSAQQSFTVLPGTSQADVDFLLMVDDSQSMAGSINTIKNQISGFLQHPSLQSANIRIAISGFGAPERSSSKYNSDIVAMDMNWQAGTGTYWKLPSAGVGRRYNSLNRIQYNFNPNYGTVTPGMDFRYGNSPYISLFHVPSQYLSGSLGYWVNNPITNMAAIQQQLGYLTTSGAQSEDATCGMVLGYQTIQTPELSAASYTDAFRASANAFVVAAFTDENATLQGCPLTYRDPEPVNYPDIWTCRKSPFCDTAYETYCGYISCPDGIPGPCLQQPPNCTAQRCPDGHWHEGETRPAPNGANTVCDAGFTLSHDQTAYRSYRNFYDSQAYTVDDVVQGQRNFRAQQTPNRTFQAHVVHYTGRADGPGGSVCVPNGPQATQQSVGTVYNELITKLNTPTSSGSTSQCIDGNFGSIFSNIAQTISTTIVSYVLNQPTTNPIVTVTRTPPGGATVTIPQGASGWTESNVNGIRKINFATGVVQVNDVIVVRYQNP
jgi:hypothetical protein